MIYFEESKHMEYTNTYKLKWTILFYFLARSAAHIVITTQLTKILTWIVRSKQGSI